MNENAKQEEVVEQQAAKTPVEAVSKQENGEVTQRELEQLSGGGGPPKLPPSRNY